MNETVLIKSMRFELINKSLWDILIHSNVKFDKDIISQKEYDAVWRIEGNQLNLAELSLEDDELAEVLEELMVELHEKQGKWFTGDLQVKVNETNFFIYKVANGEIDKMFHRKIVFDKETKEIVSDVLKKISDNDIYEIISSGGCKRVDLEKYRTEEVSSIRTKEGVFSDGRPYVEEFWIDYDYRCSMVTIFMPSVGFDIFDEWNEDIRLDKIPDDIQEYLESEGYESDFFSKGVSFRCFGREDRLVSINVLMEIWSED